MGAVNAQIMAATTQPSLLLEGEREEEGAIPSSILQNLLITVSEWLCSL